MAGPTPQPLARRVTQAAAGVKGVTMKRLCSLVLPAALCGLALLRPGPVAGDDAAVKKELEALKGRWGYENYIAVGLPAERMAVEAFLHAGKNPFTAESNAPFFLEVSGDTFTFAGSPSGKAKARLDPTRTPKTIDLTDPKGRVWQGIYELKGDKLVINLGLGETRPAAIKETSGTAGQANVIYKRAR
jgi:uncharacterized protein (TIGR03067 family)